jgi:hypothetical protein
MSIQSANVDSASQSIWRRPLVALAVAVAVGVVVTAVGELLVGDASGGGVDGATQVATDAAVAGVISLIALLLARRWPRPMLVALTLLTVLAAAAAWYTAMSFVFGAAAYALSRQFSGAWRTTGTCAGVLGALILMLFVVLVIRELATS